MVVYKYTLHANIHIVYQATYIDTWIHAHIDTYMRTFPETLNPFFRTQQSCERCKAMAPARHRELPAMLGRFGFSAIAYVII